MSYATEIASTGKLRNYMLSRSVDLRAILTFVFIAILTAFPFTKVPIGGAPIYFLDILAVVLILKYRFQRSGDTLMRILIALYIVIGFVVGLREIMFYKILPEVLYMTIRYTLSFAIAFTIPSLIKDVRTLKALIAGMIVGLTVNATVGILFSLPMTGDFVEENLFTIGLLYPGRRFMSYSLGVDRIFAMRTETFVGGANLVGYFTIMGIIFALFYYQLSRSVKTRVFLIIAILAGFFNCVLTYSRSTYLALFFLLFVILLQRGNKLGKRYIIVGLTAVLLFVGWKGIDNEMFNFERITNSFAIIAGDSPMTYAEEARINSFRGPIRRIYQDPFYILIGKGFTENKLRRYANLSKEETLLETEGGENHFYFAAILLERGLIASMVFTLLYLYAIYLLFFKTAMKSMEAPKTFYLLRQALQLVFAILLPYLAVTHIHVNKIYGSHMFFVSIGLVLVLVNWRKRLLQERVGTMREISR